MIEIDSHTYACAMQLCFTYFSVLRQLFLYKLSGKAVGLCHSLFSNILFYDSCVVKYGVEILL